MVGLQAEENVGTQASRLMTRRWRGQAYVSINSSLHAQCVPTAFPSSTKNCPGSPRLFNMLRATLTCPLLTCHTRHPPMSDVPCGAVRAVQQPLSVIYALASSCLPPCRFPESTRTFAQQGKVGQDRETMRAAGPATGGLVLSPPYRGWAIIPRECSESGCRVFDD